MDILFTDLEAESVKNLAEDLWCDLKVTERVTVLEEACGVKSVSSDFFTEASNNFDDTVSLILSSFASAIDGLGSCSTDCDVVVFLHALGCENFINFIRELSPLDVLTLLGCLEDLGKHGEFTL